MNKHLFLGTSLLALIVITGCSSSTAEIPVSQDKFDFKLFEDSDDADDSSATESENTDTLVVPNPSRTNPFASSSEDSISGNETVRLKGFVEVDEPQAVLRVNRKLIVLGEGDEERGVKVLKITPPEIVYEQGGTEHRMSL